MSVERGELIEGKYRVERVLGSGGMGVVVAATQVELDRLVAIKALRADMLGAEGRARLLREARAVGKLRSEHVARVLDVGTHDDGAPFLVMEYLEGRDLAAILAETGPMQPARAAELVLQACEGLAEAHAAGIVHRDLKPSNLFLTRSVHGSEILKILDFGISKVATPGAGARLTQTRMVVGSPGYMSPEQLRAARDVDERTDVWGLGIVLYELTSGRLPFPAELFSELCIQIATEPVPSLEKLGLPAAFAAVVGRCLEKAPDARYASMAELAAALAPFADEGSAAAARTARVLRGSSHSAPASPAPAPRSQARTTLRGAVGSTDALSAAPSGGSARRAVILGAVAVAVAATLGGFALSRRPTPAGASDAAPLPLRAAAPPIAIPPPDAPPAVSPPPDAGPAATPARQRPRPATKDLYDSRR